MKINKTISEIKTRVKVRDLKKKKNTGKLLTSHYREPLVHFKTYSMVRPYSGRLVLVDTIVSSH